MALRCPKTADIAVTKLGHKEGTLGQHYHFYGINTSISSLAQESVAFELRVLLAAGA